MLVFDPASAKSWTKFLSRGCIPFFFKSQGCHFQYLNFSQSFPRRNPNYSRVTLRILLAINDELHSILQHSLKGLKHVPSKGLYIWWSKEINTKAYKVVDSCKVKHLKFTIKRHISFSYQQYFTWCFPWNVPTHKHAAHHVRWLCIH
jgi:hypothetical protein